MGQGLRHPPRREARQDAPADHSTARARAHARCRRRGRLRRAFPRVRRARPPRRTVGVFVAVVIALAGITLALWSWLDPSHAIDHTTALLIVTCPCALGLATPLAIAVAVGRAARAGILIRGGDALERIGRGGTLFLDKTGTLTEGRASLVEWRGDDSHRALVVALESQSSHPVARAIAAGLEGETLTEDAAGLVVRDVEQTTGAGIVGTVDGRRVLIGSPRFVESHAKCRDLFRSDVRDFVSRGFTPVLAAVDGTVVGALAVGDAIRSDAAASLATLRSYGFDIRILSGDDPVVVRHVARHLGIDSAHARGAVSPEDKTAIVTEAMKDGHQVVMVGDGVNDAAALAAATVGVAVHGGAEASLAAADVYLARSGLTPLVEMVEGGRRTLRTVKRALGASLAYNAVAATLAVAGLVHPLVAAVLMPASSLTVLTLAMTSRSFPSDAQPNPTATNGGR